jgi:hypothetical protein
MAWSSLTAERVVRKDASSLVGVGAWRFWSGAIQADGRPRRVPGQEGAPAVPRRTNVRRRGAAVDGKGCRSYGQAKSRRKETATDES